MSVKVPEWCKRGKIRYGQLYAGELDLTKAIIGEWKWLRRKLPQVISDTINGYSTEIVDKLREAHINTFHIVFSNGCGIEAERPQREGLKPLIEKCHDWSIKTIAYLDFANIFWMSFFKEHPKAKNWLQRDVRGEPVVYGWPRPIPERYLACLNNPDWIRHQNSLAKLAIDMGFDGIYFDNASLGSKESCYCDVCKEKFRSYSAKRLGKEYELPTKADWADSVWQTFVDFHYDTVSNGLRQLKKYIKSVNSKIVFTFNAFPPPTGMRTATDRTLRGVDPCGLAKIADLLYFECGHTFPRVENRHLITNIETFKYATTASGGKAIALKGYIPGRPLLKPNQVKLAVAEAAAFCCTFNAYNFPALEKKPMLEDNEARRALGEYNGFMERNEEFYVDAEPVADVAVLYSRPTQDWYCNDQNENEYFHRRGYDQALIDSHILFDIIHDENITADYLSRYAVLILPNIACMSEQQIETVKCFVAKGGGLVATCETSLYDETYKKRKDYGLADVFGVSRKEANFESIKRSFGQGRVFFFPSHLDKDYWLSRGSRDLELLVGAVKWVAEKGLSLRVKVPRGVFINVFSQPGRKLVHLVDYPKQEGTERIVPVQNLQIEVRTSSGVEEILLISPDFKGQKKLSSEIVVRNGNNFVKFTVPEIEIYSLVIINGA